MPAISIVMDDKLKLAQKSSCPCGSFKQNTCVTLSQHKVEEPKNSMLSSDYFWKTDRRRRNFIRLFKWVSKLMTPYVCSKQEFLYMVLFELIIAFVRSSKKQLQLVPFNRSFSIQSGSIGSLETRNTSSSSYNQKQDFIMFKLTTPEISSNKLPPCVVEKQQLPHNKNTAAKDETFTWEGLYLSGENYTLT